MGRRRPAPAWRWGLCLAAVLGLHAAALLQLRAGAGPTQHAPSASSAHTLLLRSIQAPAEPVVATAPRDKEIADVQPNQALPADEAIGAPELQISYPDAALPGGRAHSVVAVQLDKNGWVLAVELEPGALPDSFAEAVSAAFMGQQFGPSRGGKLRLCLQVEFKEGEAPTWQILEDPAPKSAGICKPS